MSARQDVSRQAIVAEARRWIATPYMHQASLIGAGCDCLGLVRGVWRACIGSEPERVPPYSPDWAEASGDERLARAGLDHFISRAPAERQPGDVLLFRWRDGVPAKHLAILATPSTMVHAHEGACVAEVTVSPWWQRRLAYVFAFPAARGAPLV